MRSSELLLTGAAAASALLEEPSALAPCFFAKSSMIAMYLVMASSLDMSPSFVQASHLALPYMFPMIHESCALANAVNCSYGYHTHHKVEHARLGRRVLADVRLLEERVHFQLGHVVAQWREGLAQRQFLLEFIR